MLTLYAPAAPRRKRKASEKKACLEVHKGFGRGRYPTNLAVETGI
jgi:hypothetical protein